MSTTTQHAQRIANITELSNQVFANPEKSTIWLNKPLKSLNGKSPIGMLDSEEGARIVENLLGQLDEGYFT
jgi:putative toxin-antitoxin system antitoxin component (TIGR02293 family)